MDSDNRWRARENGGHPVVRPASHGGIRPNSTRRCAAERRALIRFGQPGVGMVALASLHIDQLIAILAYCKTLPAK